MKRLLVLIASLAFCLITTQAQYRLLLSRQANIDQSVSDIDQVYSTLLVSVVDNFTLLGDQPARHLFYVRPKGAPLAGTIFELIVRILKAGDHNVIEFDIYEPIDGEEQKNVHPYSKPEEKKMPQWVQPVLRQQQQVMESAGIIQTRDSVLVSEAKANENLGVRAKVIPLFTIKYLGQNYPGS